MTIENKKIKSEAEWKPTVQFIGDYSVASDDGKMFKVRWCDAAGVHDTILPGWLIDALGRTRPSIAESEETRETQ